jgi:hypothetical protein
MHQIHRVQIHFDIYTPTPTPLNPVQTPQLGAIKSQGGFPAFTGLSTRALGLALGFRPGASADQVYKPITPDWVPCTGLNPLGAEGYTQNGVRPGASSQRIALAPF